MKFLLLVLALLLAGCASTVNNLDYISVGMSRSAVVYALGEPAGTRSEDGMDYMIYPLRSAPSAEVQAGCGVAGVATLGLAYALRGCRYSDHDYFVQMKDGFVIAFGRIGELDTGQTPATAPGPIEPRK